MNNKAQFTQGPWVVTEHSAGMICVAGPNNKDLCAVGYNRTEGRNDVANATLIAAAPVMYEALRSIPDHALDCKHSYPHTLACWNCIVKAALAQAEGK